MVTRNGNFRNINADELSRVRIYTARGRQYIDPHNEFGSRIFDFVGEDQEAFTELAAEIARSLPGEQVVTIEGGTA